MLENVFSGIQRFETYILSEEKTSADGETGRLITLKEGNLTDIDISKHLNSC